MEKEDIRVKKIKFYPTPKQEKTLKVWFNHHRYTYNKAVEASKKHGYETNLKKMDLKKSLVTEENLPEEDKFLTQTPYAIRAEAVFELCAKHQAEVTKFWKFNFTKLNKARKDLQKVKDSKEKAKKDQTKLKYQLKIDELNKVIEDLETNPSYKPNIKFRKLKAKNLVIDIVREKCKITGEGNIIMFPKNLGELKLKEKVSKLEYGIKMSYNKVIGWHLIIPYRKEIEETLPKEKKFITLDPGYRTFLTGVDSDGCIKEYGSKWYDDLKPLMNKIDNLRSRLSFLRQESSDKSYTRKERIHFRVLSLRTKKMIQRKETKINNRINYMHKKITRQLLNEYETILLPKINSKRIVEGDLSSSVNRIIMLGSQCKFHDYVSFQGKERIVKVDEKYTTKVCCKCSFLNDIGSSKIYRCNRCDHESDRDVNSAVNILVKNLDVLNLELVDNAVNAY